MKESKALVMIVMACCVISCQKKTEKGAVLSQSEINGHPVTVIHMDAIPEKVVRMGISELFEVVDKIQLESTMEAQIQNAKIHFADDFFLLGTQNWPNASRLLRFDYQGKLLNQIGAQGRGPGEHTSQYIGQVQFDKENNLVFVFWGFENPQLFNPDGTFVKTIQMPHLLLNQAGMLDPSVWFSVGFNSGRPKMHRDSVKVVFFDETGKILKKHYRTAYPPGIRKYTPTSFWATNTVTYNGKIKVYTPDDHIIYRLEDLELIPEILIETDENFVPFNEEMLPEQMIGKHQLAMLAETDSYWMVSKKITSEIEATEYRPGEWGGSYDFEERILLIDKSSGKAKQIELFDDLFYVFPQKYVRQVVKWENDGFAHILLHRYLIPEMEEEFGYEGGRSAEMDAFLGNLEKIDMDQNFMVIKLKVRDSYKLN